LDLPGLVWTGLAWLGLNRIGVTELWSVGVRPGGRIGGFMDWWIDGFVVCPLAVLEVEQCKKTFRKL
jgi:hypothetical protein